MKTIWKFPLEIEDTQTLKMPIGSKILCVQVQKDTVCLWAVVNDSLPKEQRTICMCGTGNPIGETENYIGTFQLHEGNLVFHVFEATI